MEDAHWHLVHTYESRPINKLQNGIILLISKYEKSEI